MRDNWEEKYHKLVVETLSLRQRLKEAEQIIKEKTIIIESIREQVGRWRP